MGEDDYVVDRTAEDTPKVNRIKLIADRLIMDNYLRVLNKNSTNLYDHLRTMCRGYIARGACLDDSFEMKFKDYRKELIRQLCKFGLYDELLMGNLDGERYALRWQAKRYVCAQNQTDLVRAKRRVVCFIEKLGIESGPYLVGLQKVRNLRLENVRREEFVKRSLEEIEKEDLPLRSSPNNRLGGYM